MIDVLRYGGMNEDDLLAVARGGAAGFFLCSVLAELNRKSGGNGAVRRRQSCPRCAGTLLKLYRQPDGTWLCAKCAQNRKDESS